MKMKYLVCKIILSPYKEHIIKNWKTIKDQGININVIKNINNKTTECKP